MKDDWPIQFASTSRLAKRESPLDYRLCYEDPRMSKHTLCEQWGWTTGTTKAQKMRVEKMAETMVEGLDSSKELPSG